MTYLVNITKFVIFHHIINQICRHAVKLYISLNNESLYISSQKSLELIFKFLQKYFVMNFLYQLNLYIYQEGEEYIKSLIVFLLKVNIEDIFTQGTPDISDNFLPKKTKNHILLNHNF